MSTPVVTKPISYLATTLTTGTVQHKITITTKPGEPDLTGITGGRVRYTSPAGVVSYWACTVSGTPTPRSADLVHAMVTGDLDPLDVGNAISLRALYTVSGTEYLDGPEAYTMPVLP